jgi:hypothetical protein
LRIVSIRLPGGVAPGAGICCNGRRLGVGSPHEDGDVVDVVGETTVVAVGGGPASGGRGLASEEAHPDSRSTAIRARTARRLTGTP